MRTLKKKVWAGLALNLATLFIGIWDFGVQDGLNTAVSGLAIAMILSFLLSVTGVVMLLRGKASGGIIAVAGSLIFVPAGLICMLGSLQSRADLGGCAGNCAGYFQVYSDRGAPQEICLCAVQGAS
ncbi:hypothetical protein [uncultured Desulfovibrio sp.]|uniref:hypothetical protein n=1 Tax=uncultured Desulfovibrio sp. TaxID=167968 RepID=UPI0026264356|nr:hypothetical protein [uncultured Desulfovibrio sp.]